MKLCSQCGREYDNTMSFCLDDGMELLYGPGSDEPQTAILHDTTPQADARTRTFAHTPRRAVVASKKNSIIAGVIGIVLVTVIGVGSYLLYGRGGNQIGSIAVMPFVNDSGNSDADYLSDGMTETLISSLSQLKNLNVKPRSMVFRYKGKDIDLQTAGKELGVEAILSGRLVPRGGDISLFVELIDVASTKVIWSRQYNRKQADLVALQSDIARDVSRTLNNGLSTDEERKVIQTGTNDPEAYRLYLLARSLSERRKDRETLKAIEYYEQAVALDPNYAAAYGGLARAHTFTALYGSVPFSEALAKARLAQLRVLELTPDSPEAHVGLGATMLLVRDFAGSEREVSRALELNPDGPEAHRQNGLRLAYLGRLDQAIAEFKRTIDLDSTATTARINYAWCLFFSGRSDESDVELKAVKEIDPSIWFAEFQLFNNSRRKGDFAAAVEHLAHAQELRDEPEAAKLIRDSFKAGGWNGMMRAALEHEEQAKIWDYYLATFAAELGEKDKAFALLDKAADKYDQFVLFAKIDPAMEPLRGDPRYGELLGRLGLK